MADTPCIPCVKGDHTNCETDYCPCDEPSCTAPSSRVPDAVVPGFPHATEASIKKVAELAARLATAETLIRSIKAIHRQSAIGSSCHQCQEQRYPCSTLRMIKEIY